MVQPACALQLLDCSRSDVCESSEFVSQYLSDNQKENRSPEGNIGGAFPPFKRGSQPRETSKASGEKESRAMALLLKKLSARGKGQQVQEIFENLRKLQTDSDRKPLGVHAYTAMISLCAKDRQVERALALYEDMRVNGITRNVHTFSAMMNVCIKSGQLSLALRVYNDMREANCVPNRVTYHTLIDAYGKHGEWQQAVAAKTEMEAQGLRPDVRTYNTLMIACNTCGQWQEALKLYEEFLASGLQPNTVTYNALITTYSRAGLIDKVMEVYEAMPNKRCDRTVITYSSVITACNKAGKWALALNVLADMQNDGCTPNIVTYNGILRACAQGSKWELAEEFMGHMQRQGCAPDFITHASLISMYLHAGKWYKAVEAFNRMQNGGHKPDQNLYCSLVESLWDTGLLPAQRAAISICQQAMAQGAFASCFPASRSAHCDLMDVILPTTNLALPLLVCYFVEIRDKLLGWQSKAGIPPQVVRIWINKGKMTAPKHVTVNCLPGLHDVISTWLVKMNSPFVRHSAPGSPTTLTNPLARVASSCLAAPGADVLVWLLSDEQLLDWLSDVLPRNSGGGPVKVNVRQEEASEESVRATLMAVAESEMQHNVHPSMLPPIYKQVRAELFQHLLSLGPLLASQRAVSPVEVVLDSMLILDRFVSALPHEMTDMESLVLAALACAVLAMRGSLNLSGLPDALVQQISVMQGIAPAALNMAELAVSCHLDKDVIMLGSVRCLVLMMTHLAAGEGPFAPGANIIHVLRGPAFTLLQHMAADPDFMMFPPSIQAAAALFVSRTRDGCLPLWPTGLQGLVTLENPTRGQLLVEAFSMAMNRLG